MSKLESGTSSISDLLGKKFYAIPNYQRPFSWDRDQLSDLVDDLAGARRDNDYFLGTLVLHETPDGVLDVVDGQQRLTALTILLACLRDRLDHSIPELQELLVQPAKELQQIPSRPRLAVRDAGPYESMVSKPGGTNIEADDRPLITSAEERYRLAVSIFHDRLKDLAEPALKELASFILLRVVVITLQAPSFDDAFRLFTVVNDRGKQLRRIDILKAMNLSPSVILDPNLREQYARKWETFEETLGEDDFESLFHALRLIYVQDKPEGDLVHEFETRVHKRADRPKLGTAFIDELKHYVDLYEALFINRDLLSSEDEHPKFKSLLFVMVNEFRASEWRACLLAHAKRFGTTGLLKYAFALEGVFVDHWVRGMRKDERYSTYTTLLKAIEVSNTAADARKSVTTDLSVIRGACRNPRFYGAGYAKYLLLRAELQASELNEPKELLARSIEHVLPQTLDAASQWRKDFTDAEHEELLHSSGNLVLLSKRKNSAAQNKDFEDKKRTYLEPQVSDYPRCLTTLSVDKWSPTHIRDRTEAFAISALEPF